MSKTLTITEKNARGLYPTASKEFKTMLEDSFGKDFFNQKITDRVKTFEDACEVLGISTVLPDVSDWHEYDWDSATAYYKLIIIARALNEGWTPDYSSRQPKYCNFVHTDAAGFASIHSLVAASSTAASFGSRLCFKTRELANYAANQFGELYKEYLLLK